MAITKTYNKLARKLDFKQFVADKTYKCSFCEKNIEKGLNMVQRKEGYDGELRYYHNIYSYMSFGKPLKNAPEIIKECIAIKKMYENGNI